MCVRNAINSTELYRKIIIFNRRLAKEHEMQRTTKRSRQPPRSYNNDSSETTYAWTNPNGYLESTYAWASPEEMSRASTQYAATIMERQNSDSIAKDPKLSQPFKRVFDPVKDHAEWLTMNKHPGKGNWPKELPELILFWKSVYPDLDEEELADLKESPKFNPRTCYHRNYRSKKESDQRAKEKHQRYVPRTNTAYAVQRLPEFYANEKKEFCDNSSVEIKLLLEQLKKMYFSSSTTNPIKLPLDFQSTAMELPELDQITAMELPELVQGTVMELPELDDATAMELPELDQGTVMELPELDVANVLDFQSTAMELPELDQSTAMELPDLEQGNNMELPELDVANVLDFQGTGMDLPELDDDILMDFKNTEIDYEADEMALMARRSLLLQQYAEEDPADDLIAKETFVATVVEKKKQTQPPQAPEVQPRDNLGKFAKKTEEAKKTKKQPDTKKYVAAGNFLLSVRYEIPDAHRNVNSVPTCFSEFINTEEASANVIEYLRGCVQFGVLERHRSLNNYINQGKAIDFYFKISSTKGASKKKPSASELYKKLAEALKLPNADDSNVRWFQKRRALAKIYDLLQLNRYGYRCSPTELLDIAPQIERARKLKLVVF